MRRVSAWLAAGLLLAPLGASAAPSQQAVLTIVFAGLAMTTVIVIPIVWISTAPIRNIHVRSLLRALSISAIWSPVPFGAGHWPVLMAALVSRGNLPVQPVLTAIALVTVVLYGVLMVIAWARRGAEPRAQEPRERSTLVTLIALVSMILAGMGLVSTVLAYSLTSTGEAMEQLRQSAQAAAGGYTGFMVRHLHAILIGSAIFFGLWLVSSIGLLLRMRWARAACIGFLAVEATWTLIALAMAASTFGSVGLAAFFQAPLVLLYCCFIVMLLKRSVAAEFRTLQPA